MFPWSLNPCTSPCTWIWALVRILALVAGRGRLRLTRRGRIAKLTGCRCSGEKGRNALWVRKKDASCRLVATRGVLGVKAGEGIRTLDVQLWKLDGSNRKALSEQRDTRGSAEGVPNCVPSDAANVTDSADASPLAVIADLLADLPEDQRRGVISDMAPADRVAVAKMLVSRLAGRERRPE